MNALPEHERKRRAVPPPADDGDRAEYDQFVRSRTPALLRSAYLSTGDQFLAEDLVQTALARTHRAWRRLDQYHATCHGRRERKWGDAAAAGWDRYAHERRVRGGRGVVVETSTLSLVAPDLRTEIASVPAVKEAVLRRYIP